MISRVGGLVLARVIVAVSLVAFGVVVVAPPAFAAPAWSVVPSPSPPGPPYGDVSGVTCPTTTSCFAVGQSAAVRRWNGTSWSITNAAVPAGALIPDLSGVACTSPTSCLAVGFYASGSTTTTFKTLAEHWDGTSWSITTTPNPILATNSFLGSVACATPTSCFAVGSSYNTSSSRPLIEHWNGTSWSIATSPIPTGATYSSLHDIACPSAVRCIAVGDALGTASVRKTLVERWDGATWSVIPSPNPAGGSYAELGGVACTSAANCFAVGGYQSGGGNLTLVEHWNGFGWSIVTSPNVIGATGDVLGDVSCPSAANCYAVGSSQTGSAARTLVEHWDGTSWTIMASPNPLSTTAVILSGVACPGATSCFAAGSYYSNARKPLMERLSGASWTILGPPSGSSQSELEQVQCPSATSCFAVGSSVDAVATKTLVEHWNGAGWSTMTSPNPTGAQASILSSVSCPTLARCFAVGSSAFAGFVTKTLVESWNGSTWSIVASPNPSGASFSTLTGVSCRTAVSCFAVGSSNGHSLVEHWDGTSWSIMTTPNPVGASDWSLSSVSCASTARCFAVGSSFSGGVHHTLAEWWNGSAWSITTSPDAAGASESSLSGVSCPGVVNCFAVGSSQTGSVNKTLVERWNGSAWSIVVSPNPGAATILGLSSVSCVTAANCFAVGYKYNPGRNPLVEHWNGISWSIVAVPIAAGATGSSLNGVACSSATSCFAVGRASAPANEYTFIERYS